LYGCTGCQRSVNYPIHRHILSELQTRVDGRDSESLSRCITISAASVGSTAPAHPYYPPAHPYHPPCFPMQPGCYLPNATTSLLVPKPLLLRIFSDPARTQSTQKNLRTLQTPRGFSAEETSNAISCQKGREESSVGEESETIRKCESVISV
jgi:hypothetical protein